MTVYVHKLAGQSGLLLGRVAPPNPWFSLTASTDDELHALADKLGLTREMFRPGIPAAPRQAAVAAHYALTEGERDRAIALGAMSITSREAARMERQWAAGLGYN
jgi:hypothetical protein